MKSTLPAIIAAITFSGVPLSASAQVSAGASTPCYSPESSASATAPYAPPPQPAYTVSPAPYPNSQLVPGYWAWGPSGYYWVPAYWTAPPAVGYSWTPGYWSYSNSAYIWMPGYWGPIVGFYGGINYGFGYFGTGFVGGYWSGSVYNYNTAVVNVNRTVIHNTYNRTVSRNATMKRSRVSFNGRHGGISARPTTAQLAARRLGAPVTSVQRSHQLAAAHNRSLLASVNHGHPRVAAVQKPIRGTGHNGTLASAHRGAPTTTAHRNGATVASHHSGTVSGSRYGTPSRSMHSVGMAGRGYSHTGAYGARFGGGYSHVGMYGGRPGGGYPHPGMYGGRPSGGFGGHPGGGAFGGHPGGGGGRPPRG